MYLSKDGSKPEIKLSEVVKQIRNIRLQLKYRADKNEFEREYEALIDQVEHEAKLAASHCYIVDLFVTKSYIALSNTINKNGEGIRSGCMNARQVALMQDFVDSCHRYLIPPRSVAFDYRLFDGGEDLCNFEPTFTTERHGLLISPQNPKSFLEALCRIEAFQCRTTILAPEKKSEMDEWFDELLSKVRETLDRDENGNDRNFITEDERKAVESHLTEGKALELSVNAQLYLDCIKWCYIWSAHLLTSGGSFVYELCNHANRVAVVSKVSHTLSTYLNLRNGDSFDDAYAKASATLLKLDESKLDAFDKEAEDKAYNRHKRTDKPLAKKFKSVAEFLDPYVEHYLHPDSFVRCKQNHVYLKVVHGSTNDKPGLLTDICSFTSSILEQRESYQSKWDLFTNCNSRILNFLGHHAFRPDCSFVGPSQKEEVKLFIKVLRTYASYYNLVHGIEKANYPEIIIDAICRLGMMLGKPYYLSFAPKHETATALREMLAEAQTLYTYAKRDYPGIRIEPYTEFAHMQKRVQKFFSNMINLDSDAMTDDEHRLAFYHKPFFRYFARYLEQQVGFDWYYIEYTLAMGTYLDDNGRLTAEYDPETVPDAILRIVTRPVGINNCPNIMSLNEYDDDFYKLRPIFCLHHILCHVDQDECANFMRNYDLYPNYF